MIKFQSVKLDDIKITVLGDTAVAYLLQSEVSTHNGSDTSGQYRWTDMFAKRDGVWKAVASHGSRVAGPTESTEQIIRKHAQDWVDALVKADFSVIDRIVAPDWMLTGPGGSLLTKVQADADLKSGALKFASLTIDEMKVAVFGDMAVVYLLETEKSSYKGSDFSGQVQVTDVFVKRNGTWQAVTTSVTRVVK